MKTKLRRVLLIDDDEPTNFLNKMFVKKVDCAEEILVFQSASKALDFLASATQYPELIFLDVNMPAMDGWEFLDAYEQLPVENRKGVLIIMLTTSFNPEDHLRAEQFTAVAGLRYKPLSRKALEDILDNHFKGLC